MENDYVNLDLPKKEPTKFYRLYCEICGYCKVTDGVDVKLVEYQRSKIQGHIPILDQASGKTIISELKSLPKKYKCPQCGRLIGARSVKEVELKKDEPKVIYEKDFNKGSAGGFEKL